MTRLFILIALILCGGADKGSSAKAASFEGSGANIVEIGKTSSSELPGDYSLKLRLTDDVRYEPFGASKVVNFTRNGVQIKSKVISFNPKDNDQERGVWIRNAGFYDGEEIDVKLVIDAINFTMQNGAYPSYHFFATDPSERLNIDTDNFLGTYSVNALKYEDTFLMQGGAGTTDIDSMGAYYRGLDKIETHYEFYSAKTGKKVDLKGIWNIQNINVAKTVSFAFSGNFQEIYMTKTGSQIIEYDLNTPTAGNVRLRGNAMISNSPDARVDKVFTGNRFDLGIQRSKEIPGVAENGTNPMLVYYNSESLARIAPTIPSVFGKKNSATHGEEKYLSLGYSIVTSVSDNQLANRNSQFVVETAVPDYYDIVLNRVKVFSFGTTDDLTNQFTYKINPSTPNKLIMTAIDPSSDIFNGQVLDIQVEAIPNDTFKFDKSLYNYQIGGEHDGHMRTELSSATTVSYEVKDTTGKSIFSNTLTAKETAESKSHVLYEGAPTGKAKSGLTLPFGSAITEHYDDVSDMLVEGFQFAIETDNPIDRPVVAHYKEGLPATQHLQVGEQVTIMVILTSAKGIIREVPVTLTIVSTKATLNVRFINDNPTQPLELYPPIELTYNVMDRVNLTQEPAIIKALEKVMADGYMIKTKPLYEEDYELVNTKNQVDYIFSGKLIFASAPSHIDFGEHTIKLESQTYTPETIIGDLAIKDTRANRKSWKMTAKLGKLLAFPDGTHTLSEGLRYVSKGQELILTGESQEITTMINVDRSSYKLSDGWSQKGDGLKIQTEIGDITAEGQYRAEIIWTLAEVP